MNRFQLSKKAAAIRKQTIPTTLCYEALKSYIEKDGWNVLVYGENGGGNEKLEALGLADFAATVSSFAYSSGGVRIIALRSRPDDFSLLMPLAHEIGHIECGHDLSNLTSRDEAEADDFVYALLSTQGSNLKSYAICGICCVFFLFGIWGIATTVRYNNAAPDNHSSQPASVISAQPTAGSSISSVLQNSDKVLITKSGDKYHRPDCVYVRDRTNTIEVTIEDAIKAGKEPCKICRPELEE